MIKGIKKASAGICVILPSKPEITLAPKVPPNRPIINHGNLARATLQILASRSIGSVIPVANWKSLSASSFM